VAICGVLAAAVLIVRKKRRRAVDVEN